MTAVLIPAVLLGVLGSAHCAAMCGPLHVAVGQGGAPVRTTVLLNTGRLITYMAIGALFGLFGRGLGLAGLQRFVAIALAVVMLAALVVPALAARLHRPFVPSAWVARLRSAVARRLRRSSAPAVLLTGALNGLLPCGMVYMAVVVTLEWPISMAIRFNGTPESARFLPKVCRSMCGVTLNSSPASRPNSARCC